AWRAQPAGDLPADRPARQGVQSTAGPPPLCGGAVAGLAGRLPTAAGPPRAAPRHPHDVPAPGVRADLPQGAPTIRTPPSWSAPSRGTDPGARWLAVGWLGTGSSSRPARPLPAGTGPARRPGAASCGSLPPPGRWAPAAPGSWAG